MNYSSRKIDEDEKCYVKIWVALLFSFTRFGHVQERRAKRTNRSKSFARGWVDLRFFC